MYTPLSAIYLSLLPKVPNPYINIVILARIVENAGPLLSASVLFLFVFAPLWKNLGIFKI